MHRATRGRIAESGADIGFAFDGDGDRLPAVDRTGRVRDGDEIVAIVARHLRDAGQLPGGVAITVMTNSGFRAAMADAGIEVDHASRRPVRDRGASRARLGHRRRAIRHVVWMEFALTGDGIAAALLLERALNGADLADVVPFERLPQKLVNVELADRDADRCNRLWEAVEREGAALATGDACS